MGALNDLGVRHGTDKARHVYNGVSYLDVYEIYLEPRRATVANVVEIGVLRGQSLRTWHDYFPQANIWGIDIDPAASAYGGSRITILTGSQADPEILAKAAPGQLLDLVIDDGSHLVDHMITSFEILWPRLRPGGFYVMEDTNCSYDDMRPYMSAWPGQSHNPESTNFNNDRAKLNKLFYDRIFAMDTPEKEHTQRDTGLIHFWPRQVVLRKV